MEFMAVVRKRRSIRSYSSKKVSKKKIDYILEAARLAPSWTNSQCWKYIIVKNERLRRKIAEKEWIAEAPIIIVCFADPSESGNKHNQAYYMLDVGISMEHLILAATDIGLGTCWIGGQFNEEKVKKALNIPEKCRVVALTPVGYPKEEPKRKIRKKLHEISIENKWKNET
jgi:nitroreductase